MIVLLRARRYTHAMWDGVETLCGLAYWPRRRPWPALSGPPEAVTCPRCASMLRRGIPAVEAEVEQP